MFTHTRTISLHPHLRHLTVCINVHLQRSHAAASLIERIIAITRPNLVRNRIFIHSDFSQKLHFPIYRKQSLVGLSLIVCVTSNKSKSKKKNKRSIKKNNRNQYIELDWLKWFAVNVSYLNDKRDWPKQVADSVAGVFFWFLLIILFLYLLPPSLIIITTAWLHLLLLLLLLLIIKLCQLQVRNLQKNEKFCRIILLKSSHHTLYQIIFDY